MRGPWDIEIASRMRTAFRKMAARSLAHMGTAGKHPFKLPAVHARHLDKQKPQPQSCPAETWPKWLLPQRGTCTRFSMQKRKKNCTDLRPGQPH